MSEKPNPQAASVDPIVMRKQKYKFGKFSDGWWSIIYYVGLQSWGKWRGPFKTKIEAQLDCANIPRSGYELPD